MPFKVKEDTANQVSHVMIYYNETRICKFDAKQTYEEAKILNRHGKEESLEYKITGGFFTFTHLFVFADIDRP